MRDKDTESAASLTVSFISALSSLAFLPLLFVLIITDILMRHLLGASWHWTGEIGGLLLFLLFITALPLASFPVNGDSAGRHLAMSYFYDRMSATGQRRCQRGYALGGAVLASLIFVAALSDVVDRISFDERSETLGLPLWPASAVLGACALIMGVYYAKAFRGSRAGGNAG